MINSRFICIILCISLVVLSGCWDNKELNDRAIWLASGWDVAKNNGIELSGQIILPFNIASQTGGQTGKGFFVITDKGINVEDAMQNIQLKLSREAFLDQRNIVFLSEAFARRGLKKRLDVNNRSPDVNLRTDVFIVKGATAKEALELSNSLEKIPALATLKLHSQLRERVLSSYLKLLISANSVGSPLTLPAVEISKTDSTMKTMRMTGLAIFNRNLELMGFLNMEEDRNVLWILGLLKKITIITRLEDGNASLLLNGLDSKVIPKIKGDNISLTVTLTGTGNLVENNSKLDLMNPKNRKFLQRKMEKQAEKQVLQTITKAQKEFGMDIFDFGDVIHRKHPKQWKRLKKNWDKHFAKAEINVNAKLEIMRTGVTGPALLLNESEIKK